MTFEFIYFHQLVHTELPLLSGLSDQPLPDFEQRVMAIRQEAAAARARMTLYAATEKDRQEIAGYARRHQTALILLADQLYQLLECGMEESLFSAEGKNDIADLCRACYKALEELLFFIERNFRPCFNQDEKLPELYRLITARELEEKARAIRQILLDRGIQPALLWIALLPVEEFVNNGDPEHTSFRRLRWLRQLLTDIARLPGMQKYWREDMNEELVKKLCYLNLNSERFCHYCIERCKAEIMSEPSEEARIKKARWILSEVQLFRQKSGAALRTNRPSLKEQVAEWLIEKLKYLQENQAPREHTSAQPVPQIKLMFAESSGALAYLAKLCDVSGFMKSKTKKELERFFAHNFSTPQREHISEDAFHTRYNNVEKKSRETIERWLAELLKISKTTGL